MPKILALDLATNCGFAHNVVNDELQLGTFKLATASEITKWNEERLCRRRDPRVARLFAAISYLVTLADIVIFEDVEFQSYTQQCQLWSSLRATVWLSVDPSRNHIECVPVATLKKFATGHGGATKEMMVKAAVLADPEMFMASRKPNRFYKHGVNEELDDNAADAYHLFRWAELNLSRVKL